MTSSSYKDENKIIQLKDKISKLEKHIRSLKLSLNEINHTLQNSISSKSAEFDKLDVKNAFIKHITSDEFTTKNYEVVRQNNLIHTDGLLMHEVLEEKDCKSCLTNVDQYVLTNMILEPKEFIMINDNIYIVKYQIKNQVWIEEDSEYYFVKRELENFEGKIKRIRITLMKHDKLAIGTKVPLEFNVIGDVKNNQYNNNTKIGIFEKVITEEFITKTYETLNVNDFIQTKGVLMYEILEKDYGRTVPFYDDKKPHIISKLNVQKNDFILLDNSIYIVQSKEKDIIFIDEDRKYEFIKSNFDNIKGDIFKIQLTVIEGTKIACGNSYPLVFTPLVLPKKYTPTYDSELFTLNSTVSDIETTFVNSKDRDVELLLPKKAKVNQRKKLIRSNMKTKVFVKYGIDKIELLNYLEFAFNGVEWMLVIS